MNKLQVETGQAIRLTWLDSSSLGGGWVYDELQAHPKEIESIGFVCDVNDTAIMITSTRSPSGGVVSPLTIPIGCIQEYTVIVI